MLRNSFAGIYTGILTLVRNWEIFNFGTIHIQSTSTVLVKYYMKGGIDRLRPLNPNSSADLSISS